MEIIIENYGSDNGVVNLDMIKIKQLFNSCLNYLLLLCRVNSSTNENIVDFIKVENA